MHYFEGSSMNAGRRTAMTRRRPKLKPSKPWGVRVDALIRACGWPRRKWRLSFDLSPAQVTRIRYHGTHVKVGFLLQLKRLESAYAKELEALAKGLIVTRGRVRYDWRNQERTPQDH
jgi:hypothetical protein